MRKIFTDIFRNSCSHRTCAILSIVLSIGEIGFRIIVWIRNFLYDRNILEKRIIPCKVISIGNITIGGTGKTPLVIMIADMLKSHGKNVAVVSRGYKGSAQTPIVVSDGSSVVASSRDAGDESLVIASALSGIPIVIGKNRVAASELAYRRFKPDVIILDDGMQHRRLHRDRDIVVLRGDNPFGNGHLLPRGILREPPFSLSRAHAVVVTHCRDEQTQVTIERTVREFNPHIPIFFANHVPLGLRHPFGTMRVSGECIQGQKVGALSNIAYPESFHRLIESLGVMVVWKSAFEDHHRYTSKELERIEKEAIGHGAETLIMTAKDERNLPDNYDVQSIEKLVLDITIDFVKGKDEFLQLLGV
jgi:tetraacyldisaccharide 4'-kinase